jgi:hypothetical protein
MLDCLEERTLPSIIFGSHSLVTTSDNGGPVIANVQVELIFWGSKWTASPSSTPSAAAVENAVDSILTSGYLSGLSQYRSTLGTGSRVGTVFIADSSPPSHFTSANVNAMLLASISDGTLPAPGTDSRLLYMVVTQSGSSDPVEGLKGEHASWNEICDGRAEAYQYRLTNDLVQSYWSQQDQSYVVPTGQHQNFLVGSEGMLTVNGDQLGSFCNDSITLNLPTNGAVQVTLNGESAEFEPGTITGIAVKTGAGNDAVKVLEDSLSIPITIDGAGKAGATANHGSDVSLLLNRPVPEATDVLTQFYRDLLGRPVDASGLVFWTGLLRQGVSRRQVALGIETSLEYRTNQVENLYGRYLHRAADPLSLNAVIAFLAAGGTVEQVAARLAGSQEYFDTRAAGSVDGFLDSLYQDVLQRGVDPGAQAAFGQAIAAGVSRVQLAAFVLGSMEYEQDLVQRCYRHYLGRSADASGLGFSVNALQIGVRDEQILAAIVGSDEYFARL